MGVPDFCGNILCSDNTLPLAGVKDPGIEEISEGILGVTGVVWVLLRKKLNNINSCLPSW